MVVSGEKHSGLQSGCFHFVMVCKAKQIHSRTKTHIILEGCLSTDVFKISNMYNE